MLAVCSWCLMCAPALVWVQHPATSLGSLGCSQQCTLHIPEISMWTNRMCLAQPNLALKMGEKIVFYFIACVSWVPRVEVKVSSHSLNLPTQCGWTSFLASSPFMRCFLLQLSAVKALQKGNCYHADMVVAIPFVGILCLSRS